jgi:GNAT superfamily N-acetyltransferase
MLTESRIEITTPSGQDAVRLGQLFDDFRAFYERSRNESASIAFIAMMLERGASQFFVATEDKNLVAFVHLLPYYDTLSMTTAWILEDLFVRPVSRNRGIGSALLQRAEAFVRENGAARISLTTAHTNLPAQRLYEANGYALDDVFRTYHLEVR